MLSWHFDLVNHPIGVRSDGGSKDIPPNFCSYAKITDGQPTYWCPHKADYLMKVKDKEEIHLVCLEHYPLVNLDSYSRIQRVIH